MNVGAVTLADKPRAVRHRLRAQRRREAAFVARYQRGRPAIVAAELYAEIGARFGYRVGGDWRRARCVALTAACEEYERVALNLSGGKARRLVAERFRGLPLGESATGRAKTFQLGPLTLWRALRLWRHSGRASPAAFTMQLANCGRHPKR